MAFIAVIHSMNIINEMQVINWFFYRFFSIVAGPLWALNAWMGFGSPVTRPHDTARIAVRMAPCFVRSIVQVQRRMTHCVCQVNRLSAL